MIECFHKFFNFDRILELQENHFFYSLAAQQFDYSQINGFSQKTGGVSNPGFSLEFLFFYSYGIFF